jgi:hypothetical protein
MTNLLQDPSIIFLFFHTLHFLLYISCILIQFDFSQSHDVYLGSPDFSVMYN